MVLTFKKIINDWILFPYSMGIIKIAHARQLKEKGAHSNTDHNIYTS